MATWHIPLHNYDVLDNLLDLTFPPRRYVPLLYDWSPSRSQRDRRLAEQYNPDLFGLTLYGRPYLNRQAGTGNENEGDKFKVHLDVKHYKPDEISTKVEGRTLTVQGQHTHESEHGFEKSEFQRQYTLPEDVDTQTVTTKITQDGVLCIEAAKQVKSLPENENASPDESKLQLAFNVSGYKPDEISVKVVGRNLVLHGESKNDKTESDGQFVHHKQFTRQIYIPEDVDISALSSRFSKDGKVIIEAPRLAIKAPEERQLELKHDTEGDQKMDEASSS